MISPYFDDIILDSVDPCVTSAMNQILIQPFTNVDVRCALFGLNPSKALGLDGFLTIFFQSSWDTIKDQVINQALQVLNNLGELHTWNNTIISLSHVGVFIIFNGQNGILLDLDKSDYTLREFFLLFF